MSFRMRLTLWYAGTLIASVLLIAWLSYDEFVVERKTDLATGEVPDSPREAMGDEIRILLVVSVPAAVMGLVGGWLLMRKSLSPVIKITQAASRFQAGDLNGRLDRTGNGDELDRLTMVFNEMADRIDQSFKRVREFTLHASHELKTPLTVLRGEMESTLRDGSCPPAFRDQVVSHLDEIERLTRIVDGLTLLTKSDAGQVPLCQEPAPFAELVRDCFEDTVILAAPKNMEVVLPKCDEAVVRGDRHRLRQLLLILADNAVKYGNAGGRIELALRNEGGSAFFSISNSGPGVAPDQVPRVFDRFFRGKNATETNTEGCGLGLSIAHWIVRAHGGTIGLTSEPGRLTRADVQLPVQI